MALTFLSKEDSFIPRFISLVTSGKASQAGNQPSHIISGDLSRVLGDAGIKIVNLSPLLPKQNIWGRMAPQLPPEPGHQGKEKEREVGFALGGLVEYGT